MTSRGFFAVRRLAEGALMVDDEELLVVLEAGVSVSSLDEVCV